MPAGKPPIMDDLSSYQPTDSELEILQILWANEPATVRFVYEQINREREVGYTTVLKQLQRLAEKGVVARELKGKTHYYRVLLKQADVQNDLVQQFLSKVYQGASLKLVMHALGQGKTSPEELEELQKWVEAQKKKSDD